MKTNGRILAAAAACCSLGLQFWPVEGAEASPSTNTEPRLLALEPAPKAIWQGGVGEGFARGVTHVGVVAGAGPGVEAFGSRIAHDLALAGVAYGKMWGGVQGADRFYRGNWEWRVELIGGSQFYPEVAYVVGLTPHLRYSFATGTRWVPFLDAGVGATATDIGRPDLGGTFEFNLQATLGLNYFLRDNLALSVEGRWLHLSAARLTTPNLGANTVLFLAGLNWYF